MIGSEVSPYFSPCPERRFSSTTRKATMTKATKPELQIPQAAVDLMAKILEIQAAVHVITRVESAGDRIVGNLVRDVADPKKTKRHIDKLTSMAADVVTTAGSLKTLIADLAALATPADDPDGADG